MEKFRGSIKVLHFIILCSILGVIYVQAYHMISYGTALMAIIGLMSVSFAFATYESYKAQSLLVYVTAGCLAFMIILAIVSYFFFI